MNVKLKHAYVNIKPMTPIRSSSANMF